MYCADAFLKALKMMPDMKLLEPVLHQSFKDVCSKRAKSGPASKQHMTWQLQQQRQLQQIGSVYVSPLMWGVQPLVRLNVMKATLHMRASVY